ncbi:MAG: hypothetical protein WDN10_04315 [bacterium]
MKKIRLKIASLDAVFDPLDPEAIPNRRLSADWLEYVFEMMEERDREFGGLSLVIPPDVLGPRAPQEIVDDMKRQLIAHDESLRVKLKKNFRTGRVTLLLALVVLAVFESLSVLSGDFNLGPFQQTFSEGFLIIGWVALWRPVEILLYDWWPIVDERRKVRKLLNGKIEVVSP